MEFVHVYPVHCAFGVDFARLLVLRVCATVGDVDDVVVNAASRVACVAFVDGTHAQAALVALQGMLLFGAPVVVRIAQPPLSLAVPRHYHTARTSTTLHVQGVSYLRMHTLTRRMQGIVTVTPLALDACVVVTRNTAAARALAQVLRHHKNRHGRDATLHFLRPCEQAVQLCDDMDALLRRACRAQHAQWATLQRTRACLRAAVHDMNVCYGALAPQTSPQNMTADRVTSEDDDNDKAMTTLLTCASLLCGDVCDEAALARADVAQLVALVPLLVDWLAVSSTVSADSTRDGDDESACAVDGIASIVHVHGGTLLRDVQLRKLWRTVVAALHTWCEQQQQQRHGDVPERTRTAALHLLRHLEHV